MISMLATLVSAVPDGPNHGKVPKISGIVVDGKKDAGYDGGLVIEFSRVGNNAASANIA